MKIKKIIIKNYRIFGDEFKVDDLNVPDGTTKGSGITVFVGENGCGKSSLLEAIALPILSYKAESFSINDFNDPNHSTLIEILADKNFSVDGTMPNSSFLGKGFSFEAKKRERINKSYLSTLVVSDQKFIKADGETKPKDNSPDLRVTVNNPFKGQRFNENDILFLDKNRIFQTRSGTYSATRFDRLMEDFDHQYVKSQTPVINLNQEIDRKLEPNIEHKFFAKAIERFEIFSGIQLSLNYIDNYKPFTKAFFADKKNNNQLINLNMLGSGYEMIFSLIYSYFLSEQSGKQLILLIDEPELHLHPTLQAEFVDFLLGISTIVQIILTSQSPLFVKQLLSNPAVKIYLIETDNEDKPKLIQLEEHVLPTLSANEINFLAFNLATEEYHNELYGYLQEKTEKYFEKDFDNYLAEEKSIVKNKFWQREKSGRIDGKKYEVTSQTFIRNKIHHPENKSMQSVSYNYEDLERSIQTMRELLKSYK